MIHLKEGIFCDLHATTKEGRIKVEVLHKPQIGNLWIHLWVDETTQEHLTEYNLSKPELISFKDYQTYCEYVGSEQFNSMFEIVKFNY